MLELPMNSLQGIAVLVVDDDPDTLELVAMLLVERGAEVRTASNARDAVSAIEGWSPHVAVLDVSMPDADGCTLLQTIRARAETRVVRAIAFTANAFDADVESTRAAGFDRHITKPAEIEAVGDAVAELAALDAVAVSGVRAAVTTRDRDTG